MSCSTLPVVSSARAPKALDDCSATYVSPQPNELDRLFAKLAPDPTKEPFRANSSVPIVRTVNFAFRYAVSPYRASGIVRDSPDEIRWPVSPAAHPGRLAVGGFQDPRIRDEPYDAIVPIPLHPTRLRERGFNQACAIGEIVARRADVSLPSCLERRRNTEIQTRFDRKDRRRNLRDAFALRNSIPVAGKRLLLVDNVLTTGSTLHECALVLLAAGTDTVRAVTVARG